MSIGIEKLATERVRQIEEKGYDAEHDHNHVLLLRWGAQAYLRHAIALDEGVDLTAEECQWPWSEEFWKPGTAEEDLIKAGAMIAADLDVLELEKTQ